MIDYVSRAEQEMNLIRHIGDEVNETGQHINQLSGISGIIGAQSESLAIELVEELEEQGLIRIGNNAPTLDGPIIANVTLSSAGWERYEAKQRGVFDGDYGFLAMKFGDHELDAFANDVLKPAVKKGISCALHDLRDKSKAGIIDNILRETIEGARFIIADLTHDNSGAYWEAGYAEGLGKPVVYICEKGKFEEASTHFDTNHLMTILWSKGEEESFCRELVETLSRSLEP